MPDVRLRRSPVEFATQTRTDWCAKLFQYSPAFPRPTVRHNFRCAATLSAELGNMHAGSVGPGSSRSMCSPKI